MDLRDVILLGQRLGQRLRLKGVQSDGRWMKYVPKPLGKE